MGICCTRHHRVNASTMYYSMDVRYPRKTIITIKKRNSRERIIHREKLELINTQSILTISEVYALPYRYLASTCVIPGKDPRGNFSKVCRDFSFITCEDGNFIAGVFDGHGKDGEKIVSFCISETDHFFSNELTNYNGDYFKFLEDLIQFLELQLIVCSGIDISNSGASCLIILIVNCEIYAANLGCNRLVLATSNPTLEIHRRRFSMNNKFQFMSEISNVRGKYLNNSLSALQLSNDHKPESPSETLRIVSKGGRVKRLSDEYGNYYGPYRVSPNFASVKGLSVSRCLGDSLMKDIGIISMPHISNHRIEVNDKFFIAASDGIWRVMNNKDAVDFVDSHRRICLQGVLEPTMEDVITPENSCISQLLCEEARLRWLAKVENEDSIIDDISCVIVEFQGLEGKDKASTGILRRRDDKENDECEDVEKKGCAENRIVFNPNHKW